MKKFEYDHIRHEVGGTKETTRYERISEFMEMLNKKARKVGKR